MTPKFDKQKRLDLVLKILRGGSVTKISREEKISRVLLYRWLKRYKQNGKRGLVFLSSGRPRLAKPKLRYNYLSPRARALMVREVLDQQTNPAEVAKKFNISRVTFYKWLNRYKNAPQGKEEEALLNKTPQFTRYFKQTPEKYEESILRMVVEHPEYGIRSIVRNLPKVGSLPIVGHHGVQNVLRRNGLLTYAKRLEYSQSQNTAVVTVVDKFLVPVLQFFNLEYRARSSLIRYSGTVLLSAFLTLVVLGIGSVFANNVIWAEAGSKVGLTFAFISLVMGSIFFLYSLKYYLTLAIVLSYSQDPADSKKSVKSSIMARVLGIGSESKMEDSELRAVGLESDLSSVKLSKKPFISVQIPFYNEKNVVERAIRASTGFKYAGEYEVVLCDDSTDETTALIRRYQLDCLFKNEELKEERGDGYTLTSVEVRPGVTLKHLHRTSRAGYKGKALDLALKLVNPKTEFVAIFDADFVPYPDSLDLFLKYFKAGNKMSEDFRGSNLAAVQGYQWHVLNKSENWITRGVRGEYAGSYVIERSGAEIYGGLKQISGSVYMIRRDVLAEIGWGSSITEDFELTLRLYNAGYKVLYTPYVQAPAECVSTLKRLVRQRMRWAEGHSFNIKKMFFPMMANPDISVPEKLELIYLAPYYLQAFFFLAGTLSWLISETVFRVKLPFWSELWGWSLVLTNMFALPLVNAVGLFVEESEERDYMGLASFIGLSYLLVPFQAYASVKGLLENEEGPWFRTPKTGRITDIFSRGKFYRFIQGFLPGVSKTNVSTLAPSPYLKLNTANNRFESNLVPHKRARGAGYVSKAAMAVVLSVSMITMNVAPYFGSSATGSNLGRKLLSSRELKLTPVENINKAGVNPEFNLQIDKSVLEDQKPKKSGLILPFMVKNASANSGAVVKARLLNSDGVEADGEVLINKKTEGNYSLSMAKTRYFTPGKYTLETTVKSGGKTYTSYQDFNWGVLAINTNKRIYLPGEEVRFSFGVLNDKGETVCDAELNLNIVTPEGKNVELNSKNGGVVKSGQCSGNSITNTADYLANYNLGSQTGVYKLNLEAKTNNGLKTVYDEIKVSADAELFIIERVSYPTRIYPPATYPVNIKITANTDYKGKVTEDLPYSFEVGKISDNGTSSHSTFNLPYSKTETQTITWDVDYKKGNTYELTYTLKFPPSSPEFYLAGPVKIGDYEERGVWQIAADVNTQIRQEINIINTTITGSTASNSDAIVRLDTAQFNGTVTYYFEAVISGAASNTGTVTLRRSGTSTDDATLTGRTDATLTRTRSSSFTPPAGITEYVVRNNADGTRSQTIKSARIIVIQNATSLTSTQTQIEIGAHQTGISATSTTALTAPKYWKYTSANWDGTVTAYAEATYKQVASTTTPTYQDAGTAQSGLSDVTVPWPASHAVNDIGLLVIESTGGQPASLSTAEGFAAVSSSPQATGTTTNGTQLTVYWARATSTSMASPVVTDPGNHVYARIFTFRNVDTLLDPWENTNGSVKASASTSLTWPEVTTTTANSLVLFIASRDNDNASAAFSGFTGGNISGHTEITGSDAGTASGNGGGIVVNSGTMASAGSTGTPSGTVTSSINAMMTISLRPVVGTTTVVVQEDDGSFGSWSDKANIVLNQGSTVADLAGSGYFTLTAGRNYRIASKNDVSGPTHNIYNAKIVISQAGGASSVTYDTTTSAQDATLSATTLTWSHTSSASATSIVVGVGTRGGTAVTSVTYAGESLTLVRQDKPGSDVTTSLWFLNGPTAGANDVVVTIASATEILAGATTLIGADSYHNATGDSSSAGTPTSASVNVTSATGEMVIDVINLQNQNSGLTADATQTQRWTQVTANQRSAGSTEDGAGTVSMDWTWNVGQAYAHTAASFYSTNTSSITKLEPQYLMLNSASTTTGSALNYQTLWDSSEWGGVTNTYYHAQDARGASANARIVDRDNSNTVVTNSSITGANQQISSALTMPTTGHNLDTWIVAAGTSVDASRILVAVSVDVVPENPLLLLLLSPFLAYAMITLRKRQYAN